MAKLYRRIFKGNDNVQYYKGLIQNGEKTITVANDILIGDIVLLSSGRGFYVDDISQDFATKEISELYGDDEDEDLPRNEDGITILPAEHVTVNIEDDRLKVISGIPGNEKITIYRKLS